LHDGLPLAEVLADGPDERPCLELLQDPDGVAILLDLLDRGDAVRPLGYGGPGGDPNRFARPDGVLGRMADWGLAHLAEGHGAPPVRSPASTPAPGASPRRSRSEPPRMPPDGAGPSRR